MAHLDWCGEPCAVCTLDCWLRDTLDCFPDKSCMANNGDCIPGAICPNVARPNKLREMEVSNLALKRKEANLSQSKLAKASNVPVKTIQSFEAGIRDINKLQVIMALRIADALKCDVRELLEEELKEGE